MTMEWIGSVCCHYNPVHSLFMTYHRVCYKSTTTGATSGARSAPYRAHVEMFVLLNIYFVDHCLFFFFCPLYC